MMADNTASPAQIALAFALRKASVSRKYQAAMRAETTLTIPKTTDSGVTLFALNALAER
jgi:hypothetical protein